ncbi:hypothetical protein DPMN_130975 [Dreissena polymorpha]|uniref:Uncharacterized protein n=1 Tax=Dreissena polymorpha TaxID=45954 RepID=A0A9D4H631_DREPO|nr:hypothetical protein DPMN_130975 [Dreissena polymorpha]
MPKITVSVNGKQKLLSHLKPDKAVGPDNIKPIVLHELSSEISPESMDICNCNTAVQERE